MQQHGGYLRKSDLANYQPEWVEPVSTNYRGYDVHEIPPNGQGMIALMALNILSEMNTPVPHDTQSLHEQIESMKLAFTDGQAFITEPSDMPIKPEHLLSKEYAQQRAAKIAATATHPRTIRTTKRRHSLPSNRRRGRQYGVLHPIKLHGLRLRHRHSRYRNRTPKPRRRFLTRPESPERIKTRQTNISHHYPRLPNKKRPSSRTIRRHGRIHAAARPFPSSHQHHRLQTKSASSPRRTTLAVDKRQSSPRRTGIPEPSRPSTNQTRPQNPANTRLWLIRPRPNHLAQSRNRRPIRRHRIPNRRSNRRLVNSSSNCCHSLKRCILKHHQAQHIRNNVANFRQTLYISKQRFKLPLKSPYTKPKEGTAPCGESTHSSPPQCSSGDSICHSSNTCSYTSDQSP